MDKFTINICMMLLIHLEIFINCWVPELQSSQLRSPLNTAVSKPLLAFLHKHAIVDLDLIISFLLLVFQIISYLNFHFIILNLFTFYYLERKSSLYKVKSSWFTGLKSYMQKSFTSLLQRSNFLASNFIV